MRLILIFLMMLWAGQSMAAPPSRLNSCGSDSTITGGDSNPWPWGRESVFPWLAIEGVWVPMDGDCGSLFVFQAKNIQAQNRVIQVVQYDPSTCQKIAWGVGIEQDRVVLASMVTHQGKSFDLSIRAFDENAAPNVLLSPLGRNVVVMSMYPKGNWERRTSYQMQKVTNIPALLCDSKIPVF